MPTVLIIEDNIDSARLARRSLERKGYDVLHAADGTTGMQTALDAKPDVILLDLGLPDVEGQTIAALLKNRAELSGIPLVAVTAWPPATAKRMALAYGCDGYISKPINPREFPNQVSAFVKT